MKKILSIAFLIFVASINYAQEVKLNNNLVIEADGTIRMDSVASVFDDLMIYPDATTKGGSKPPAWGGSTSTAFIKNAAGTSQGVFLWMFSASTEQELYFTVQIPHGYKVGSNILPHVHWTTKAGTPSGTDVQWGLEYTVAAIGSNFPTTTTIVTNTVIAPIGTPSGTGQHLISSFPAISGTGLGISTVLICRLYRDATNGNDTFGNEVGLLGVDFHIEKDTYGSRTEFTK